MEVPVRTDGIDMNAAVFLVILGRIVNLVSVVGVGGCLLIGTVISVRNESAF